MEQIAKEMQLQKKAMIPKRDMKSYAGKVNHVANLIWAMKPSMGQIWAACESKAGFAAARGGVWKRQVKDAISWILAFLLKQGGRDRPMLLDGLVAT